MGPATLDPGPLAVSIEEAKAWLRIAGSDEDALLAGHIRAAARLCEQFTGTVLIARAVEEAIARGPAWQRLALAPVRSIDAAAALDEAGGETALVPGDYAIDIDAAGTGWVRAPGRGGRVRVRYAAGLADGPAGLPEPLRQGMLRMAAHLHVARDADASGPPAAVTALWRPWRRLPFGQGGRGAVA
jgi:uncharacterized phiE125 gp8 family phage protein